MRTSVAAWRFVPVILFTSVVGLTVWEFVAGIPTIPAARTEAWWVKRHQELVSQAKQGGVDLLFLGDSITQNWDDNETWKTYYAPRRAANLGFYNDRTQHVLWRIQNGELDGLRPRVVVLLIGTNNIDNCSSVEIASGVKAVVAELRKRLPETKILLLGVFPRSQRPDSMRAKLRAANEEIAKLDDGDKVHYLDIGSSFLEKDGTISKEIMPDFLHLSVKGYERWAAAMEPSLKKLLGEGG